MEECGWHSSYERTVAHVAGRDLPEGRSRRECVPFAASAAQSTEGAPGSINVSTVYAYDLIDDHVYHLGLCMHRFSVCESCDQVKSTLLVLFRKADSLLKEQFGRPRNEVDKAAVQQRMSDYQSTCFAFLAQEGGQPAVCSNKPDTCPCQRHLLWSTCCHRGRDCQIYATLRFSCNAWRMAFTLICLVQQCCEPLHLHVSLLQSLAVLAASLKRVPVDNMPRLAKQLEDACIAQSHKFSLDEGYAVVNDLQRCRHNSLSCHHMLVVV